MNKRIKYSTRKESGKTIYVASIQVEFLLGTWLTISTKEDDEEWSARAQAAEAMSYLADERYVEQDRLQDAGQISQ